MLNSTPAIVAARARQGTDFQIGVGGRTGVKHILLGRVRRHVRETVGKSHQTGLEVGEGERCHVHGSRERQIGRSVQEAGAYMSSSTGREVDGGRNRRAVSSCGEQGCGRRSRRVAMDRIMVVGLQLLELPVHHQIGIACHRLFEAVTAGLQRADFSRSVSRRSALVHRDGPGLRLKVASRVIIEAKEAIRRYIEIGHGRIQRFWERNGLSGRGEREMGHGGQKATAAKPVKERPRESKKRRKKGRR